MTKPLTHAEEVCTPLNTGATGVGEVEALAYLGFTEDEITSLLWLRQWYQCGGSDRIEVVRRLEYVQQQVRDGSLER